MALSLSREFVLPPVTQEKVALSPDSFARVQKFLQGISDVRQAVDTLLNEKERVVVGISGGSASGKSFVVDFLQSLYGVDGLILSLDRYYRDEEEKPEEVSWDEPEALHLEEAREHVAQLLKGEKVKVPIYSYLENKRMGYEHMQSNARVVFLEGLYALSSSFTHDTSLYIHADEQSRLIRRVLRDVERKSKVVLCGRVVGGLF
jgi:uridine kinase